MRTKILKAGNRYIVETGKRGVLTYGRLIDVDEGIVRPEEPVQTILRFLPYADFHWYTGPETDLPDLVVKLLRELRS